MRRQIIRIDEELCNGCGNCIIGCSEGALQLVDGKARLVREDFCDGFGDCVGTCPTGALVIEEREAEEFDELAVKQYLLETQGVEAVWRMEEAQRRHEADHLSFMGCPGARSQEIKRAVPRQEAAPVSTNTVLPSELSQWPVQIHLVSPTAPYFNNKELVVMSTCGPLASADVHWRYLRGRSVVVGCPKLDDTRPYAAKLAAILKHNHIPKVIVARMEVPCCGGLTAILQQAVELSGRNDIVVEENIIGIDGAVKLIREL